MAKPNYSFEKRQRELARKKKQEEKRLRHARPKSVDDGSTPIEPSTLPAEPAPDKPVLG
ncbi:conserved hypothetical protein [Burkholderiales bacterium]|jgi:hypothetical protein|nr:conserved hypothetical protein [Burkholderiales bacterium]